MNFSLKSSGIALVIVVAAGLAAAKSGLVPGLNGPMGAVLTAEQKKTCGLTAEVTEGPFFVSQTAGLADGNLNYANLPGEALVVSGFVYDGLDKTKPLTNAKIETGMRTTLAATTPMQTVRPINMPPVISRCAVSC